MNTTRTQRFAAAIASVVTAFALLSTVVAMARPPVADSLFSQAGTSRLA